jgi:hypothetical protein
MKNAANGRKFQHDFHGAENEGTHSDAENTKEKSVSLHLLRSPTHSIFATEKRQAFQFYLPLPNTVSQMHLDNQGKGEKKGVVRLFSNAIKQFWGVVLRFDKSFKSFSWKSVRKTN